MPTGAWSELLLRENGKCSHPDHGCVNQVLLSFTLCFILLMSFIELGLAPHLWQQFPQLYKHAIPDRMHKVAKTGGSPDAGSTRVLSSVLLDGCAGLLLVGGG